MLIVKNQEQHRINFHLSIILFLKWIRQCFNQPLHYKRVLPLDCAVIPHMTSCNVQIYLHITSASCICGAVCVCIPLYTTYAVAAFNLLPQVNPSPTPLQCNHYFDTTYGVAYNTPSSHLTQKVKYSTSEWHLRKHSHCVCVGGSVCGVCVCACVCLCM